MGMIQSLRYCKIMLHKPYPSAKNLMEANSGSIINNMTTSSMPGSTQSELTAINNDPKTSSPLVKRPSLTQLAKKNLEVKSGSIKRTPIVACPTMRNLAGFAAPQSSTIIHQPESTKANLDLTPALLNEPQIKKTNERCEQSSSKLSKEIDSSQPDLSAEADDKTFPSIILEQQSRIDISLLKLNPSSFGRALVKQRPSSSSVFLQYDSRI